MSTSDANLPLSCAVVVDTHTQHSSPRRHSRRHNTHNKSSSIMNAHLQVLGRDGRDLPLVATVARSESGDSHTTKSWWNGVWRSTTQRENDHHDDDHQQEAGLTVAYASLTEEDSNNNNNNHKSPPERPLLSTAAPTTTTATNGVVHTPSSSSSRPLHTLEDEIRQDCSFFYRDFDEEPNRIHSSQKSLYIHSAGYRTRYQQLNQENEEEYHDRHYDLELYTTATTTIPPTTTNITNSSLYYKQDGRLFCTLPKDKVRLVMDPCMAPGILSTYTTSSSSGSGTTTTTTTNSQQLHYILTIPPDLYQRVIREIATPRWMVGDKVHIYVAVVLLGVILMLLFINTLIYPGD